MIMSYFARIPCLELLAALNILLVTSSSGQSEIGGLAWRLNSASVDRNRHKPMYNPVPPWSDRDKFGMLVSQELAAELRAAGSTPGKTPGRILLELPRYDENSMLNRVLYLATHEYADRVIMKHDYFVGPQNSANTVAIIALIGLDGRRALVIDLSRFTIKLFETIRADRAKVFFVRRGSPTAEANCDPEVMKLEVCVVVGDDLRTEAARDAERVRVTLGEKVILDTALDGDLTVREQFFSAYESAIDKMKN